MYTRSPGDHPLVSVPTASISPAASDPGTYGSDGLRGYVPARTYPSTGLTPIARIATSTSDGAGLGSGSSSSRITSGGPNSRTTIAVIYYSRGAPPPLADVLATYCSLAVPHPRSPGPQALCSRVSRIERHHGPHPTC